MSNEQIAFLLVLVTAILLLALVKIVEQRFGVKNSSEIFMIPADKLYHYFGICRYCKVNEKQLAVDVSSILARVRHTSAGKYLQLIQGVAIKTRRLPTKLDADDQTYRHVEVAIECVLHELRSQGELKGLGRSASQTR